MSDRTSLRRAYDLLAGVMDKLHCGLYARDVEGQVVYANDRLVEWLGRPREDIVGRSVEDFAPAGIREQIRLDLKETEKGDVRTRLLVAERADGTTFPILVVPQQLKDAKGRYEGSFAVVVDLGAILTAKQIGFGGEGDLRSSLVRIALELQSIGAAAGVPEAPPVPLHHPDLAALSPRETEVLSLLMGGERVSAIGQRLHISQHTVRNHLKAIYRKVGVQSQSELIDHVRTIASVAPV